MYVPQFFKRFSLLRVSLFPVNFLLIVIHFSCSNSENGDSNNGVIPAENPVTGISKHFSFTFDGVNRSYILYIPKQYDFKSPLPLVLNFHGYTSNASQQMGYGDFRTLADEENFFVVHPQGTLFNGNTHWNVGGWTVGSMTDDVGFTEALISEVAAKYALDLKRVYATGMSNGGYMSFLLACELSNKIAAIASVTGSMTPETFDTCNPKRAIPVMQIHGTNDATVPYNGAAWSKAIDDVINYWVVFNNCENEPMVNDLSDINAKDNSTVEMVKYTNGDNASEVIHYKVTGGGHTWPGAGVNLASTNYDLDASRAIWEFFDKYDIEGLRK